MNARILPTLLTVSLIALPVSAQEKTEGNWKIGPGISITKVFPGGELDQGGVMTLFAPPSPVRVRYEGTGLAFSARGFSSSLEPLALYVSGGVFWYGRTDTPPVSSPMPTESGIGATLAPGEFMSFPLSAGVQLAFPYEQQEKVMVFVGLHGTANFISGNVDVDQQVKFGYELVGGFAVRVFEFGVRYSAFSDMRNLGAYLGIRLNSIAL